MIRLALLSLVLCVCTAAFISIANKALPNIAHEVWEARQ